LSGTAIVFDNVLRRYAIVSVALTVLRASCYSGLV
jgi:hypothetical protein